MLGFSFLVWNVRGLNNPAKRALVKESVISSSSSVVCFQESKLSAVNQSLIYELCGLDFDGFVFLPAEETRGGVIIAWKSALFRGDVVHIGTWSVTVNLCWLAANRSWSLTSVYGPQGDEEKLLFLEELSVIREICLGEWLIAGDFNLIAAAEDKNNSRINRRLLNAFRSKINDLELKEMYMFGRRYTWSSEQARPTLVKLDRILVTTSWEDLFPEAHLQALSSSNSDHCPLLLTCGEFKPVSRRFRFETFWTKLNGFMEVVKESWERSVDSTDPFCILYVKMARLSKILSKWGQKKMSNFRLQLRIANEIILRFDVAQEVRILSDLERQLRAALKGRCLALASLERIRIRQRARVRNLREGDASTAYFFMKMKSHQRKLKILRLEHDGVIATTQEDMEQMAKTHFEYVMGASQGDLKQILFQEIHLARANLSELDDAFTEEEVWATIKAMPNEKSPGPDGFTGLFYQRCWDVIKKEVLEALHKFCTGNSQNLELLNTAIITLLPKKDAPTLLKDFRPISLIHSFAKLATKILALRLAPRMDELVAHSQSAFIKGRSIHENFIFVKGLATQFH
jgi:exonuclease III